MLKTFIVCNYKDNSTHMLTLNTALLQRDPLQQPTAPEAPHHRAAQQLQQQALNSHLHS